MLAIQIEKRYTKPEIVTLYCNQIPWGHGTYGVEAAARLYFGKSAKDVTLEEAALLAGIIQAPARHSPYVNLHQRHAAAQLRARPDGRRRLHHARARRAGEEGADRHRRPARASTPTPPFFVEEVRQQLEERYGAQQLYENGLAVYTTLDLKLQHAAESGARRRHAADRSPPRLPQAGAHRRRRGRRLHASELDGRGTPRAACRRWARRSSPSSPASRAPPSASAPGRCAASSDAPTTPGPARRPAPSSRPATSCACWSTAADAGAEDDRGLARSGAGVPGRRAGHPEPYRPRAGDGRRPQLRAEPLQPHHAGDAAARLDLQADRLRDGDRSRLHAGQHPAGQPGVVVGRRRPATLRAAQLRQEVRGPNHAAARRSSSRATCRRCG